MAESCRSFFVFEWKVAHILLGLTNISEGMAKNKESLTKNQERLTNIRRKVTNKIKHEEMLLLFKVSGDSKQGHMRSQTKNT